GGPGGALEFPAGPVISNLPLLTENSSHARATAIRFALLLIGFLLGRLPARGESGSKNAVVKEGASSVLEFIETDFENASGLVRSCNGWSLLCYLADRAESRALIVERQ